MYAKRMSHSLEKTSTRRQGLTPGDTPAPTGGLLEKTELPNGTYRRPDQLISSYVNVILLVELVDELG